MKRAGLIVANEELLDAEDYYRELKNGESHGKIVKEFSDIYGLGITPESVGLNEGEYAGYRYQAALASLGHIIICLDENVWVFMPEYLSTNQKNYFYNNKKLFSQNRNNLYYVIFDREQNIIDEKTYGYRGDKYKSLYYYVENSVDFSLERRR